MKTFLWLGLPATLTLARLFNAATYALAPGRPVAAFTVSGGKFAQQHLTIASPADGGQRPGAPVAYWSQRASVGTELDAKSTKPLGLLLHVPAAGRGQTGTFPLLAGAVINNGGSQPDITLTKGNVTITSYGTRVVGTFTASGSYIDFAAGMKPVLVVITNGSFDLARGADH